MCSRSPVGVAAGMSVRLEGACVTDVTIWLWTNRYKVYGTKHFFQTIMQGTVHPRQVLETRQTTKSSKIGSALTPTRVNAT